MKTIIFDMYGVIIKEAKGNFIPYVYERLPDTDKPQLKQWFTQAGSGLLTSNEFLTLLGFDDPEYHMKNYVENYLTMDGGFYNFADEFCGKYDFALLSNDVSAWSEYICEHYGLNGYLSHKIVSADIGLRKPDPAIYTLALERISADPADCVFVDNKAENVRVAEHLGIKGVIFGNEESDSNLLRARDFAELAELMK